MPIKLGWDWTDQLKTMISLEATVIEEQRQLVEHGDYRKRKDFCTTEGRNARNDLSDEVSADCNGPSRSPRTADSGRQRSALLAMD